MKASDKPYYLRGIPVPETPAPGKELHPWKETHVIGKPLSRADAYQRVSGAAIFPSDTLLPDMLYGAILRCPYPNALVKSVDVSQAERLSGVRAVITGSTPGADLKWTYLQGSSTKLFDPHCRFEGETVAAVAAETPYQAWDAVQTISVQYQVLPYTVDERSAIEPGAPKVHQPGNRVGQPEKYQRGGVEKGFSEADVVLEQDYRTECELHTPLELHGCVAKWDGDQLTIWESTQGVYGVQSKVAQVLALPLSKVRVVGHYIGGGFGSKLQPGKYTVIAALLAKAAARPVKLFLSREETFLSCGNRPPSNMRLKAGVKKDGTLTALQFSVTGTGGAYPAGGVSLVDWLIRDLYTCPNVQTEAIDIFTHTGPARPFRAPGHPQGSWALEQMLDALAEKISMDPVELRLKNIPAFSQARDGNPKYTTTGLRECLETGAKTFGWREALQRVRESGRAGHIKRGVGMAACLWVAGGGGPPSTIIIKLFSDGSANLNMGASDIGTGTKTVMAMVLSEELGLDIDRIQIENADTGTTQYATPSGGSKTVPTEAPAVRAAAVHVKQQLLAMAAEDLKTQAANLIIKDGEIVAASDPSKKIKITDVAGLKKRGVLVGVGYRGPNPKNKVTNPFGAQFCEVLVNTRTGEVEVVRFVAAQDSGRVMNRLTYENQVIGGITMGIGLAMTEFRVLDKNETGKLCNKNWHDYKLPTALDVPSDIVSVPVELEDSEANSTGAKGLGEPVTIPTAAAIANAVYNATGIRVTTTPINPVQLSLLLSEAKIKG
ncbi:MAG: xanthine dehydrogenase family protein molybdopterin-binding subunit [Desulfomonile tiedjei]|uniref:Xanthine dehydrogenase family protein molybdopterin-binding subunit n=1 Tax=Desulfomonile tiedjei TaxID=2358 RepID=A0A9D6Z1M8_9BACT|nr:xanthine dehydrogenase family protein molybdopterin-binding subunit [Desulfomonile tiedjei]